MTDSDSNNIIDYKNKKINLMKGKIVGLYFSAHYCGPCRQFTPKLITFYNNLKTERDDFEILFCSSDINITEFYQYFNTMPWKCIPFNSDISQNLAKFLEIRGIPALVFLGKDGEIISKNGRMLVENDPDGYLFPWDSKLNNLELTSEGLNECQSFVLITSDKRTIENFNKIVNEFTATCDKYKFFYGDENNKIVSQIRSNTKTSEPYNLMVLDIQDNGGYYVSENIQHTLETLKSFIDDFQNKKLRRKQME